MKPGSSSTQSPQQMVTGGVQPPHYFHSFHSPFPQAAGAEGYQFAGGLQSFGQQGHAPFGYTTMGAGNQIYVPNVGENVEENKQQPVYHLKVTATPIDSRKVHGTPEYVVVSAAPNQAGGVDDVQCPRDGKSQVVAHVLPSQRQQAPGFTIKPIYETLPTPRQPLAASIPASSLSSGGQAPPPPPSGQQAATGYVHIYGAGEKPSGSETHMEQGGIVSRAVVANPQLLKEMSGEGGINHSKMYSWVIPTTAAVTGLAQEVGGLPLEEKDSLKTSYTEEFQGAFAQASAQLQQPVESEEAKEGELPEDGRPRIVSSPTDEALGLPKELRPTVVYAGVEHAPPEFAGTKGPLGYKLHAVEVHQYIPIPQQEDPWIIKNQMDPSTTAIFGPMPLPFDPAHSGMVAPTFQRTIENRPAPVLSPEVARMFNHELPIVNYTTTAPAEAN